MPQEVSAAPVIPNCISLRLHSCTRQSLTTLPPPDSGWSHSQAPEACQLSANPTHTGTSILNSHLLPPVDCLLYLDWKRKIESQYPKCSGGLCYGLIATKSSTNEQGRGALQSDASALSHWHWLWYMEDLPSPGKKVTTQSPGRNTHRPEGSFTAWVLWDNFRSLQTSCVKEPSWEREEKFHGGDSHKETNGQQALLGDLHRASSPRISGAFLILLLKRKVVLSLQNETCTVDLSSVCQEEQSGQTGQEPY